MFKKGLWMAIALMVSCALTGAVEGTEAVKLKDILQNPNAYKGKEVVLEGNFGGVCSDGEDFYFKEGLEIIEVVPKGFPMPRLDKGKRIRVYGVLKSIDKKEEARGKEKEEEHKEVSIEAGKMEVIK